MAKKMMMKKYLLIAALVTIFSGVALVGGTSPASVLADDGKTNVKIDNFTFNPATVTVKAGSTVHWTNGDDIPHTVASTDKIFKSKVMDTNEEFEFKFDKPGTYEYFCSLHPKMTGKVIVQ
jgi:plastocyanin